MVTETEPKPPQRWRPAKGPVVDVDLPICGKGCSVVPFAHRHCPCGCGSVTTTDPTGLRKCDACGALCLHNEWDRGLQYWLCKLCKGKLGARRG